MTARDWFILSFTFFVGMFSGWYIYVTYFKMTYDNPNDSSAVRLQGTGTFDIIAVTYGGDYPASYQHPSYRVDSTGSYRFYPGGNEAGAKRDSTLPDDVLAGIVSQLEEADLALLASERTMAICTATDVGYQYSIVYNDNEYTLDTCTTNFSHRTPLGAALLMLWEFETSSTNIDISFGVSNVPADSIFEDKPLFQIIDRILEPFRFLDFDVGG